MKKKRESDFQNTLKSNSEKNKDMGLVLIAILMVCFFKSGDRLFAQMSIIVVVVSLIAPSILQPISFMWYGGSELLGMMSSRVLLSVVYVGVILPIGIMRRLVSGKMMLMERWKKDSGTVFTLREKQFSGKDMVSPF